MVDRSHALHAGRRLLPEARPRPTTTEDLRGMADDFARCTPDLPLDFSPASLQALDRILNAPSLLEGDDLIRTLLAYGAYLGEVLIRNLGGRWRPADQWLDAAVVGLEGVDDLHPMVRVVKQWREGQGSLWAWYRGVEGLTRAKHPVAVSPP